jgi:RNA polymerase sigma-70 factor (ECF subfamily)
VDRDERRLAKRLRRRDPEALREAYERYGRTTFGLLVRSLGDRAAAEDVQQQVFLEVWQRADHYDDGRASLLAWILTIARSRALDQLRRRVPEPRDPATAVALAETADDARIDELVEHWHLAHLLGRLDPTEAELLRRRFYLGQSQSEIAKATGIALGTVKMRMVNGLGRLRGLLDAEGRS